MSDRIPGTEKFIFSNKTMRSKLAPQGVTLNVKIRPNKHGTLEHDLAPEETWSCSALLRDSPTIKIVISEDKGSRRSVAYGDHSFAHTLKDGRTTNVVIRTDDNRQPACLHIVTSTL